MKVNFHRLYMAIIDLEIAAKALRTYSEKDNGYVVETDALQEQINAILKIFTEDQ